MGHMGLENRRMPSYALVGGLATAVHYLVLVSLVELAGVSAGLAAATGATCGALAAYAGNRRFTFASDAAARPGAAPLPCRRGAGVATSAALVFAGTEWLGLHYLLPQAVGDRAHPCFAGFTLNRRWTFA